MHISDGILDPKICLGGYVVASGLCAALLAKTDQRSIPRIAVMGAAFFVASLIHFRIGFSSVHLTLLGLVSIVLGIRAPLAITVGLFFQALLFQHGGLSTLGVNASLLSISSLLIVVIYRLGTKMIKNKIGHALVAGVSASLGLVIALAGIVLLISFSEEAFAGFAYIFSFANGGLAIVEGIITAIAVFYILRIKPAMLKGV